MYRRLTISFDVCIVRKASFYCKFYCAFHVEHIVFKNDKQEMPTVFMVHVCLLKIFYV